ncbi:hypothetical protein PanWU01x14_149160 [Parasponia andersonii]|uniref:Uncharacterized protein n=1 Tax=Parasponia andersonii TaxID=3476 RepID=A0A2P5CIT3_PARAD|nr:hypothetical protein PanWU01x14_149160 [Parasponia andersonii]
MTRRDRAGVKTIVKARVCLRRIHSVCKRVGQAHNLDPIVESSKQIAEDWGRRQTVVRLSPESKQSEARRDRAGVKTIVKAKVCLRRIHSVCKRVGQAHNLDPIVESSKQVAKSRGRR